MELETVRLAQRPDLGGRADAFGAAAWPEFMLHDPVAIAHWAEITDWFRQYQLMLVDDDEILAIVNTVPIEFAGDLTELPDGGVDWGVKTAISGHKAGRTPNLLLGVQVVVGSRHAGKGLSTAATQEMLNLCIENGFQALVVPLRPSNKHEYPLISMEQYLGWRNSQGWPLDNWLRVHVRMNATILGICSRSMVIPGTVQAWQEWTGQSFPGSGKYLVPGALNPIEIDVDNDIGTYTEPNVWIVHKPEPARAADAKAG